MFKQSRAALTAPQVLSASSNTDNITPSQAKVKSPSVRFGSFLRITKLIDVGEWLEPGDVIKIVKDDGNGGGWWEQRIKTATESWAKKAVAEGLAVML